MLVFSPLLPWPLLGAVRSPKGWCLLQPGIYGPVSGLYPRSRTVEVGRKLSSRGLTRAPAPSQMTWEAVEREQGQTVRFCLHSSGIFLSSLLQWAVRSGPTLLGGCVPLFSS